MAVSNVGVAVGKITAFRHRRLQAPVSRCELLLLCRAANSGHTALADSSKSAYDLSERWY